MSQEGPSRDVTRPGAARRRPLADPGSPRRRFRQLLLRRRSRDGHQRAATFLTSTLHAGPGALGAIEGVSDALTGLSKLAGVPLANDPNRRAQLASGGYLGTALATGALGLATAVWQVAGLRALAWVSRGLRSPVRDTLLTSLVPPHAYGRAFGLERAGDNAGRSPARCWPPGSWRGSGSGTSCCSPPACWPDPASRPEGTAGPLRVRATAGDARGTRCRSPGRPVATDPAVSLSGARTVSERGAGHRCGTPGHRWTPVWHLWASADPGVAPLGIGGPRCGTSGHRRTPVWHPWASVDPGVAPLGIGGPRCGTPGHRRSS